MRTRAPRRGDVIIAVLIFLFFQGLYLCTLAPGIMFEDSGEFALSALSLGVSHPPGYPLFNLLGRLFQFLPVGDPGFKANGMSAFFGALGIAVLFAAAREFGFSRFASAVGAAACGLSRTLWSQASIVEVYSLNVFLNASLLWGVARLRNGDKRMPFVLAALLGFTATNHYTTFVAFAPLVVAALLFREGFKPRRLALLFAVGVFAALLPFLIYTLLPLRAAAAPIINWRDPETFTAFFNHIKRAQFHDFESQLRWFHIPTLMKFYSSFFVNLPSEFFAVFIFFGLLGAARMIADRARLAAGLAWLWAVQSLGIMLLIRFHADVVFISLTRVFFFGAYLVTGLFAAAGIDTLFEQIGDKDSRRRAIRIAVGVAIAACLVFQLFRDYRENDISADVRYDKFRSDLFRYIPRDAVFYLQGSHFTSPSIYEQAVRNLRPDVTMIEGTGNLLRQNIEKPLGRFEWINLDTVMYRLSTYYRSRNPQVFSYQRSFEGAERGFEQRGPLFVLTGRAGCDPRGWNPDSYGFDPKSIADREFETRVLMPILYARSAECWFARGNNDSGMYFVKRAVDALPESAYVRLFAGQLLEKFGLRSEAIDYYNKALEMCSTFTDAYLQLGGLMAEKNEFRAAEVYYQKALEINPEQVEARLALANIAQLENNYEKAIGIYDGLLVEHPSSVVVMNALANVYLNLRRVNEARRLYEQALAVEPDSQLTVINYSDFLIELGRWKEAKDILGEFLLSHPDSSYAWYNLGLACYREGDYDSAVSDFQKATEISPGGLKAWTNLVILLLERNRISDARAEVARMRETAGEPLGPDTVQLYLKTEKRAVELDPADRAAWTNLTLQLLQIGQLDKARAVVGDMRKAAKGTPGLAELAEKLSGEIEMTSAAMQIHKK
jgi:tetratricopeptide (TPR) repeat protein